MEDQIQKYRQGRSGDHYTTPIAQKPGPLPLSTTPDRAEKPHQPASHPLGWMGAMRTNDWYSVSIGSDFAALHEAFEEIASEMMLYELHDIGKVGH